MRACLRKFNIALAGKGTHRALVVLAIAALMAAGSVQAEPVQPPYPPSSVLQGITWHWDTLRWAAQGSDLWPVTWAADGNLYTAWGDGGGFDGTDSDGRVAMGFARIEGGPEGCRAVNVNGGKAPEHAASFAKRGKTGAMFAIGSVLYAWVNLQDGPWPDVDEALYWSRDYGATWQPADWRFRKGAGRFKPYVFLNFGEAGSGAPASLAGYVYFYGVHQGDDRDVYLGRVPTAKIRERAAYAFYAGTSGGRPTWSSDDGMAMPVFRDARGAASLGAVVYDVPLRRYLLTAYHSGPGQLGVFDAPQPWGPWTTVAYYEDWGGMGAAGDGLTCSFPAKWMSGDGLTLWCVFSVYGDGAKLGIKAHDRFNLVKATLLPRSSDGKRAKVR